MSDVHIKYINDVHCKIVCDPGILREISDQFHFFAENYRYHPKFKAKTWDGKIRMINMLTGVAYCGLIKKIKKFCDARGYSFTFDSQFAYDVISEEKIDKFIESLNLPVEVRDYQRKSFEVCVSSKRRTLLSPTSSGKSLMIYMILRWFNVKSLIIVPTNGLVTQMADDFKSYGYEGEIHLSTDKINRGDIDADITISTWQSLNNGKSSVPKEWYNQFQLVVGDEAHGAKSKSMIQIMECMTHIPYRFGTTGTLGDNELNKHTVEGLFGPTYKSISTKEMIDKNYASKLTIKCIVLKYPKGTVKPNDKKDKWTYQKEVDFLINNEARNKFIAKLTGSLKGNKLVFFRIQDHGRELQRLFDQAGKKYFYIDGDISANEREAIRKQMEEEGDSILLGSLGTTSTGINIKKLHHMIAGHPSKSKTKVLQSIGRILRLHKDKEEDGAVFYDIVDDLNFPQQKNYTLTHFYHRCKIYDSEKFNYQIYEVEIK